MATSTWTAFSTWVSDPENQSANRTTTEGFYSKSDQSTSDQGRLPFIGDGIGSEPEENSYIFFIALWTVIVPILFA